MVGEASVTANLEHSYRVNVSGAAALARAVAKTSSQRFVFVSTSHVYAMQPGVEFLCENAALLPRGHYALQKLMAEQIVAEIFRKDPSRLVIARVFSVLDRNQPKGTLANAILSLTSDENRSLSFVDDVRDFLSPRVVADTLMAIASSTSLSGTLNICSGKALSVREAARHLLGDTTYGGVINRLIAGTSAAPRIVGNPERLAEVGCSGEDLFAQSLHDWRSAWPTAV